MEARTPPPPPHSGGTGQTTGVLCTDEGIDKYSAAPLLIGLAKLSGRGGVPHLAFDSSVFRQFILHLSGSAHTC